MRCRIVCLPLSVTTVSGRSRGGCTESTLSGHRSVQDTSFRSRDRRNPGGVETRDGRANSTAVVVLVVDIPGSETFLGGPRVALLGWPLENH